MNIKLIDFYNKNNDIKEKQNCIKKEKIINNIIADIIIGSETYYIDTELEEELLKDCKIKVTKIGTYSRNGFHSGYFKLNKTNIRKLQEYIDKKEAENE